ncbi:HlyD family secretion protein [Novosphingobium sp.]|uniref:HlyD family secretion protein n=1 Tax=Novosphingobium sp. TaxID=1874826 RepID=UPI0038BC2A6F
MPVTINPRLRQGVQLAATTGLVVAAAVSGYLLFRHYESDPWTRDGRVRAEVVQVAPDVSGLVTQVFVAPDQHVHKGEPLFEIDPARFRLALRDAEALVGRADAAVARASAAITRARAVLGESRREAGRNRSLGELVAAEVTEQSETKVADGQAALAEAQAALADAQAQSAQARNARDVARLNLARTRVVAPIDGQLSDIALRPGNYVSPGKPVLALVDGASLRIEGYFEETKLAHVHLGQRATIRLMGEGRALDGHVTSIAGAIADHDRTGSTDMLPAINPSFSWVRLAQRVPVRIALDHPPADVRLVVGRTATVTLAQEPAR